MSKVSIKESIKIMGLALITILTLNIVFQLLSATNVIDTSVYDTSMQKLIESSQNSVINFLFVVIIGPVIEEFIYRFLLCGGCYKFLPITKGKEWIIVFVSATVFGYGHSSPEQIIYAFICGCILGYLYFYHADLNLTVEPNLLRPVLFHITFNGIGFLTYLVRS